MSVATRARRLAAPVGRPLRRAAVGLRTRDWPAHSRLFVEQEAAEWVLSYEARQLVRTAEALGVELGPPGWARGVANQAIFHLSQFTLLQHDFERDGNNLGLSYFHGRPGTPGMPEFDACFDTLRARHREIDRVQVTNREMEGLVLSTGIAAEKVHTIPIGIDTDVFRPRDEESRAAARARLGLPGTRVRRRLVPEGRRRLGRGARAEAHQRARRPPRGRRTSLRDASGAPLPADRSGARLRPLGARAPRHPVPPSSAARRRRGRGDVPGDRRVPRRLA